MQFKLRFDIFFQQRLEHSFAEGTRPGPDLFLSGAHKDSDSNIEGHQFRVSLKDSKPILNTRALFTSRGSAEFKNNITVPASYEAGYLVKDFRVGSGQTLTIAGVNMGHSSTFIPGAICFFSNLLGTGRYVRICLLAQKTATDSSTDNEFIGGYHGFLLLYRM